VLTAFLEWVCGRENYKWATVHHEVLPEVSPQLQEIPGELDPRVIKLIHATGISALYSHQAEAVRLSLQGKNVVLCTSTASGKTLAYQAPVLDRLVRDPKARAIFIFPLKALERDQRDAFLALAGDSGITAAVYDGDTAESERRKIRSNPPRVLITNPDMLHVGLLAFHDTWKELFGNLSHVVLDEVHTYKGIFGSHIAQVLLRIRRVCALHGSSPQFIACSATIANPGPFVSRLIGRDTAVVDRSGAPASERHFLFLKPVLSPYTVAAKLFTAALENGLKTIVFTQSRKITELITRWVIAGTPRLRHRISSYRAGFLPEERREIEAKLFSGQMDGVISTSALEMGIDVGGLDLCLLVGYPGTVINTWQRGGRVGRGGRSSAIILIAGNDALDQYFLRNPKDFFGRNCEEAVLDPLNVEVLKRHIPCAAAEVPIHPDEEWTRTPEVRSVLEHAEETGVLYRLPDGSLASGSTRPHRDVDLRGIGSSFSIFLEDRKTLIGSSAGMRVFTECHEGAVYLHRAKQYVVTSLDLNRQNVLVKAATLPYYTRALSEKDTEILGAPIRSREFPGFAVKEARLKVTERVIGYEKRRTSGQELIGVVDLDLPPVPFETVGIWLEIPDTMKEAVKQAGLHFMGGIHALEHAAISMFPLFALCDRDDIGGISTPQHEQVCRAAVFIYDGHPGGVGLAHRAFDVIEELLEKTRLLVEKCPCEDGCPSCIHSPKCGSGNKPLDKAASLLILELLMHPDAKPRVISRKKPAPRIFPDLAQTEAVATNLFAEAKGVPSPPVASRGRLYSLPLNTGLESPTRTRAKVRTTSIAALADCETDRIIGSVPEQKRIVIFDLETQKLAEEVGGWHNISKMRLSLGVAHTEQEGFMTFTEGNVADLIRLLKSADLIVGFNQMRFDFEVLSAYTSENLRRLPNLDILVDIQTVLGHRLTLDHLAEFTLGRRKSASGVIAAQWFREGKMDLLEQYCREDVAITRELYHFGREKGFLLYQRRGGKTSAKIAVKWKDPG